MGQLKKEIKSISNNKKESRGYTARNAVCVWGTGLKPLRFVLVEYFQISLLDLRCPIAMDTTNEFKFENCASDCIQTVKFGKQSNQYLLSASWDCTVGLYDVVNRKSCAKFDHSAPVLDCAFQVSLNVYFQRTVCLNMFLVVSRI